VAVRLAPGEAAPQKTKDPRLPGEGPVGVRSVVPLAVPVPPRPSVLPPGAGNEPEDVLEPEKERPKEADERPVHEPGIDRHRYPAAVAGDDDGDVAAIPVGSMGQRMLPAATPRAIPAVFVAV
jgi:hypothetical protein